MIDSSYSVWLNGFLNAGDTAFTNFQLQLESGDLVAASVSIQRFARAMHGAAQTLKNERKHDG